MRFKSCGDVACLAFLQYRLLWLGIQGDEEPRSGRHISRLQPTVMWKRAVQTSSACFFIHLPVKPNPLDPMHCVMSYMLFYPSARPHWNTRMCRAKSGSRETQRHFGGVEFKFPGCSRKCRNEIKQNDVWGMQFKNILVQGYIWFMLYVSLCRSFSSISSCWVPRKKHPNNPG